MMECDAVNCEYKQQQQQPAPAALWCDECSLFLCDGCSAGHDSSHALVPFDFDDDDDDGDYDETEEEGTGRDHDVTHGSISEAEALRYLDLEEDPQKVCARLFLPSSSPPPPRNGTLLTPERAEALRTRGFVVVDDFLSPDLARRTKAAAERMSTLRGAVPQQADNGGDGSGDAAADGPSTSAQHDVTKRGDHIAFLHAGKSPCDAPPFSEVMLRFAALQRELADVIDLNTSNEREEEQEYQLALYRGNNIGYERHRDAMPDDGCGESSNEQRQRRVTAVAYTTENWTEDEHGGQLKLWLTPVQAKAWAEAGWPGRGKAHAPSSLATNGNASCTSGSVTDGRDSATSDAVAELVVAPIAGRLIIFLSGAVDHSVLPSHANRVAVTAWYH